MSDNLKRAGSPLCDEEDEEEEDYQILTQVPAVESSSSSEASQEEEIKPCTCSQAKRGLGSQIGVKVPRAKKKRKLDGPGDY